MIIQFDTETSKMEEFPAGDEKRQDLNTPEMRARVANVFAAAIVSNAVKQFRSDKVRRAYISQIFHTAEAMLDNCIIRDEYGEEG